MPAPLLIVNVELLDIADGSRRAVDVLLGNGSVEAVEPATTVQRNVARIDGSSFFAIPGLVNAHTHSHNALSRGLGDRWSLELLLTHGPALNARRTPEDHYWSALLNGLEMLKSGTVAAYDLVIQLPAPTSESIAAVVRAYRELGMRAVVAPAIADRPFYAIVPGLIESLSAELRADVEAILPVPAAVLLANIDAAIRAHDGGGLVRLAVAPTIPAQCTDDLLRGCLGLADEHGLGLHTHLAESRVQAVDGLRRYGGSIAAHLDRLGLLGPRFVGAHGVWLTDEDARLLAGRGVTIAHNPTSNLKLGNGIAPVRELRAAGVEVALGSDGSASSDSQNLFEAMRLASHLSRLRSPRPDDWIDAPASLRMATAGGCVACGLSGERGRIARGEPADLVLLRRDSPYLQPRNDLRTQLVSSETGVAVDTVIVAGEVVLRGGRSTRVDEARVQREAQSAIDRVRAANAAEWEFARRMTPYVVQTCSELAMTPLPIERLAASWS